MNGVPDRPPYFSWKDTIAWNIGQPPVNLQKAMEFLFPLDMLYFHGGFSIRLLEGSTWPIVLSQVYTLDALDPLNSRAKSDPRNAHRTFTSNIVLGTKKNIQNLSLELQQFNTAMTCIAHLLRWFAWPKKKWWFLYFPSPCDSKPVPGTSPEYPNGFTLVQTYPNIFNQHIPGPPCWVLQPQTNSKSITPMDHRSTYSWSPSASRCPLCEVPDFSCYEH